LRNYGFGVEIQVEITMETLIIILLLAWLLGLFAHVGSLIHVLLLIALVVLVIRLLQGRPVV
jgi:hypothetical protein